MPTGEQVPKHQAEPQDDEDITDTNVGSRKGHQRLVAQRDREGDEKEEPPPRRRACHTHRFRAWSNSRLIASLSWATTVFCKARCRQSRAFVQFARNVYGVP